MKKGLLVVTIFLVTLLIACSPLKESNKEDSAKGDQYSGNLEDDKGQDKEDAKPSKSEDKDIEKEKYHIEDFFPYLENTLLSYEGIGSEFAEETSYFEFIEGNRAQIKTVNPGTSLVRIVENKDGVLKEIYFEGEFYHIENILDREAVEENIILKEPLEVGTSWKDPEGNTKEISSLNAEIKTPYKTFEALEVTTKKKDSRVYEYYVKDLGLVASIYEDGALTIKTLLESLEEKPKKLAIEKYYPIDADSDIVYVEDELSFETNDDIVKKLEEALKNPPFSKLIPVISEDTKINSINLDRSNWTLKVDFSSDLILDMNYGSSMETMVLNSIISTLGRFYNVEGLSITVDGKAYESGHYYFKEDEILEVRTSGLEKFQP